MRKITALLIGLLALVLCISLLGCPAQTSPPHAETTCTEDMPAQPGEGPAGLPTPTV